MSPTLPRIGLGCMRLSTESLPEPQAIGVIHAALDAGITLFDTATAYCAFDALGENERLLAKALALHPAGAHAYIVSKGGLRRPEGRWRPDGRRGSILEDAERTVAALGRIPDLYLLHAPDPSVPFSTSVRALREVRERGLAKCVGLSNVTVPQLEQALELVPIEAVQQGWSVFDDRARLSGILSACFERGISLIAHTPLGGPKRIPKLETSPTLRNLSKELGISAASLALAALLDVNPRVVVLPGARRAESIHDAASAMRVQLSEAQRQSLRSTFAALAPPSALPMTGGAVDRREVVLLMGLQGSGKSRLAEEFIANGFVRLNRDALGGTLSGVALRASRAFTEGATHLVLDNTYTTRASRAGIIEMAKKHGARVRGFWLDVPLHEAQVNVIRRMLQAHGRLLSPDELKRAKDNTGLTPLAHFRTLKELEVPRAEEGFDWLETRAFVREPSQGRGGRFVGWEVAQQLEATDEPTFVFAWTQTDQARVEAEAARLNGKALICTHGDGPPVCWCRPPLPGLVLEACHQHSLVPAASTVIGVSEAHRMLAASVRASFVQAAS